MEKVTNGQVKSKKQVKPGSFAEALLKKVHREHVNELKKLLINLKQKLEDKLVHDRDVDFIDYSVSDIITLPFYPMGSQPFKIDYDDRFEWHILTFKEEYNNKGFDLSYKVDIPKDEDGTNEGMPKYAKYTFTLKIIFE